MSPQESRSARFLQLIRAGILSGSRLSEPEAARLQSLLLEIARHGPDRIELVESLRADNDLSLRIFLDSLLFDGAQRIRSTLSEPSRQVGRRVDFAKKVGGGLFVGAIVALLATTSMMAAFGVVAVGLALYLWGDREEERFNKESEKNLGDAAALDELRRLLQYGRV